MSGGGTLRVQQSPPRAATGRGTPCSGDPTDLDGGAHPWKWVGEDEKGDYYRCAECGAIDYE